jgi:cell division septation protein DedD
MRDQAVLASATCAYREGDYGAALREAIDLAHRESTIACDSNFLVAQSFLARGEVSLALEYFGELARECPDTREAAIARHLADSLAAVHTAPGSIEADGEPEPSAQRDPLIFDSPEEPYATATSRTPGIPAIPPADSVAVDEGVYYVQLGAFSERVRALSFLSGLRRRNIDNVSVTGALEGDRRVFRVRAGPYPDRPAAEEAKRHLETVTGITGFVTEES